jgi:hypothetical protein
MVSRPSAKRKGDPMRRLGNLFMTAAVLGALAGCGDGSGPASKDGATGPPPAPADLEKAFKKPGTKGAAVPSSKGAFLMKTSLGRALLT